jgi:AcrR family transcriptional regulator
VRFVEEHGAAELSFRAVARSANVSHQAPYHHFGDRAGILAAIALEGFAALERALRGSIDGAGEDPLARLRAAGRAYVDLALDRPGHYRVMFRPDLYDTAAGPAVAEQGALAYGLLQECVQDCQRAGWATGQPTEVLVMACWSMVHGVVGLLLEGMIERKTSLDAAGRRQLAHAVSDSAVSLFLASSQPAVELPAMSVKGLCKS